MNITPVNYSLNNYKKSQVSVINNKQVTFGMSIAKAVDEVPSSKLFSPFKKVYGEVVESIRENYHKRLINSKFTKWFLDATKNVEQMTTHMMVAGSTLISAMYAIRTLNNDKLDKEKRKTLALNDVLTWGVSTFCAYTLDKMLNKKWEGVTRRFAAGYIKKYTDPEYVRNFEAEQARIKAECLASGKEYKAPVFNPSELVEKCKAKGITPENLNKNIQEAMDNISFKNAMIEKTNDVIKLRNKNLPKGVPPQKLFDLIPPIKNVKDFNVEVLQFGPLTSKLKGMSALKSIFIFATVYRYLVPVLVMKPANKLGAYLHKKNDEKEQQAKKA